LKQRFGARPTETVHVLAFAVQLGLTESQHCQMTAIFERMTAAAKPPGAELIAHEQALDELFAKGDITADRITAETAAIGKLQGRLRSVHLAAHLETRTLLNPDQITRYQQLRSYAEPNPPHYHHG
jgi:Spy/CpxP family protein refolding chaperone